MVKTRVRLLTVKVKAAVREERRVKVLGERDAPRFLISVRGISYGERNVEVCPGEEQADDEAGIRDQRREDAHKGDAAAVGGAPCAGGWHTAV